MKNKEEAEHLPPNLEEQIASGKLIPLIKVDESYKNLLPLVNISAPLVFNQDIHCIIQYLKLRKEKICYLIVQSEEDDTSSIGTLARLDNICINENNSTHLDSAQISITLEKVVRVINIQKIQSYEYAEVESISCFLGGSKAKLKELVEQSMELMKEFCIVNRQEISYLPNCHIEVANYTSFVENLSVYTIRQLCLHYPFLSKAIRLLQEPDLLQRFRQIKSELLQLKTSPKLNEYVRQVKNLPKGYIPSLFFRDFYEIIVLFESRLIYLFTEHDVINSEVIKLFYEGQKHLVIINGRAEDYLPQGKIIPAIGTRINNVILKFDNTLDLYITPEERYKLTDIIFYKGMYYSKVEKFDVLLAWNKEEETKLKELLSKVVEYYKQEMKLKSRLEDIPFFNPDIISYQSYAINLSFYIFYKLYDYSERNEKLEQFWQQDVFTKFETLLQTLEEKIERRKNLEESNPEASTTPNTIELDKKIPLRNTPLTVASSREQVVTRIDVLTDGTIEKEKALQEFSKLKADDNSDRVVTKNYLVQLLNMPWVETSNAVMQFKESEEILTASHYGLDKVKERIIEFLAVVKRSGTLNSPIICLVGAPGVGKTSLAKSIAKSVGRKFACLSLGGVRDEAIIRGHMRTYSNSAPGMVVQLMQRVGVNNPVILLDEIDKTGTISGRNEIDSALLELLDPKQNKYFTDHYLQVPFDLSNVMFITTANSLDNISLALRDRLEIIKIDGYTDQEKLNISKQYIIPKIISDYGLEKENITFTDTLLQRIIRGYTRESGVRSLERNIKTILRKILKKTMEASSDHEIFLTEENLTSYLGSAQFTDNITDKEGYVGKVAGLSYTRYGGDLLFVEAIKTSGEGKIKCTGRLGEVLKESIETAYSYLKSQMKSLAVDEKEFKNHDIHVHLPEGAIPKDGPSAGIAIYLAIASAITDRIVKPDIAMTGEIDLMGTVMKVGGLKEKLLAAQRCQIKTVIIPDGNVQDLTEFPTELLQQLKIIGVKTVKQVLDLALEGREFEMMQETINIKQL